MPAAVEVGLVPVLALVTELDELAKLDKLVVGKEVGVEG